MPSTRDKKTVEAIASEYCSNGRNKSAAMRKIGYAESSCNSGRAIKGVYENVRVAAAIARIDAKATKKSNLTIQKVLADLDWGIAQAREKVDLPSLARLSELRGKYLSMWSDSGANADLKPIAITEEEREALQDMASALTEQGARITKIG